MTQTTALALALCALVTLPARASDWSDTYLGYRHGTTFQEPTNPKDIEKNVINFTHASGYAYGSNFLSVDLLRSDQADPANSGGQGAQEIYVSYRHHLSLGRTFTGKPLAFGIVKDLAFSAGFEWSTKNTSFAPGKQAFVAGPTIQFKLPKGFFDLGFLYYKEKNHNAFGNYPTTSPKSADFDGTYLIAAAWNLPLQWGQVSTNFKGFANYQGPKGKDATAVETAGETLARASWMFDLGALVTGRKGALLLGPGFEYWKNKFGNPTPIPTSNPAVTKPNLTTTCPTVQVEWHF